MAGRKKYADGGVVKAKPKRKMSAEQAARWDKVAAEWDAYRGQSRYDMKAPSNASLRPAVTVKKKKPPVGKGGR